MNRGVKLDNQDTKVKDKTRGMLDGSPMKSIIIFAIPILIGSIFQQIYSTVDFIIVGRTLNEEKLAAVGVTGNITFFMFSLVIGLTGGVAIVIAQYFGARDLKTVKKAFAMSVYAMFGVTLVVSVLGVFLAKPLLIILDTPKNIIDDANAYLVIIFAGAIATVFYNWMASVLRALGDSFTPLIFLIISSVINVILDLVFIIEFNMDVEGAALATVLSQLISAILCIIYGIKKMEVLKLKKEDFILDTNLLTKMIKMGTPAGIQASLIAVSVMLMQKAINAYGSTVVAAYTGAIKIEQLAMQVGFSIALAAGTFTGQNVGANRYDRVHKGHNTAVILIVGACAIMSPLIYIFSEELMLLFVNKSDTNAQKVIDIGSQYLRIMTFALASVGILQVYQQMLRSAGDVNMTMIMGACEIVTRVAVAFIFSYLFGYTGVWWATPITWISAMILGMARYYQGGWKTKSLIKH